MTDKPKSYYLATDSIEAKLERCAVRLAEFQTLDEWREDLQQRIARAQVKFTYVDALTPEFEELREEMNDFLLAVAEATKEKK